MDYFSCKLCLDYKDRKKIGGLMHLKNVNVYCNSVSRKYRPSVCPVMGVGIKLKPGSHTIVL